VPLGGSAHSLRNQLVGPVGPGSPRQPQMMSKSGPYVGRADGRAVGLTSPERSAAPPPYDYTSRGVRQVSPLVGSPPSTYRSGSQVIGPAKGGTAAVLASDEKYPLMQPSHAPPPTHGPPLSHGPTHGPPLSHGPLPSLATADESPLPSRTKAAVGLPRYGSPTFPPPTSRESNRPAPLSVAASGVQNVPGAVRRPISFVRALEMSDQLAGAPAGRPRTQQGPRGGVGGGVLQPTTEEDERAYGSSYEIAV